MALDAKLVGRRLTETREILGASLSGIAEDAGIAKSYLLKLEKGEVDNPGLATLSAVAKALGVTLAQLLSPTPPKPKSTALEPGDEQSLEVLRAKMPASLRRFLKSLEDRGEDVPADVVRSLAVIQFRGERPDDESSWSFIYEAVKRSVGKR